MGPIDLASISTKGGIVIWSQAYTNPDEAEDSTNILRDSLVSSSEALSLQDGYATIHTSSHTLYYTLSNSLELLFVIAYSRMLTLPYVENLIQKMKSVFEAMCAEQVKELLSGRAFGKQAWDALSQAWAPVWNELLREAEKAVGRPKRSQTSKIAASSSFSPKAGMDSATEDEVPSVTSAVPDDAQVISRNVAALRNRQKKKGKNAAGKGSGSELETAASDSDSNARKKGTSKTLRKWNNSQVTADDIAAYDYSTGGADRTDSPANANLVDRASLGLRDSKGMYQVANIEDDPQPTAPSSRWTSFFSKLTSQKALTAQDLTPALNEMKTLLMDKNVASDVSTKICDAVGRELEGKKISGWAGVDGAVRSAMESTLTSVLTPTSSTDVLLDINNKRRAGLATTIPYTMTFVGVNGTGKSTSLSKVAFWLIQNKLRVLIAACDTFRSGAVEQLRVHVRNLSQLSRDLGEPNGIELYERGYGKDAAGIAKDAITYATENNFHVVLVDTAGRMQDNEPLMRALAKLVAVNPIDKLVFVGEALVGNEAVDQLKKFNRALRDFSGGSAKIDAMLLTKFDTVSDQVGAAVSMTYVTGQPILFVGTGQTYSDLKRLTVPRVVSALLN